MGVYIYQSNSELAMKNAYIGEVWTPGENTIAYYPLDVTNTVNDMKGSGTAYNFTNYGCTFGTYAGVSSLAIANGYMGTNIATIPVGASARTISIWTYLTATSSIWEVIYGYGTVQSGKYLEAYRIPDNSGTLIVDFYGSNIVTSYTGWDATKGWILVTFTYDGSDGNVYVNGNNVGSLTTTLNTIGTNFYIGDRNNVGHFPGYMSNLIIEDKCWTATEISDYFNQTKGNYGL